MLFTIELKYNSEQLTRIESKVDQALVKINELEVRTMATLAEIQAALVELETIVANEDTEFATKVEELTAVVADLTTKLTEAETTSETLQAAVLQLQQELAAANDPAVLEAIATKIADLKVQVENIVE